jgi:4-diphosphocytidyl-2C-methyl-D-erythritol kinase
METKKMTLANVQGKLSRAEMKNVMAGSGGKCLTFCQTDSDCGSDCPKCKQGGTAKFCEMN